MNRRTTLLILIFLFVIPGSSCTRREPVKIGFIGGLTGRIANLAICGRDGAILAVEEWNERGGIHGRPIELIIKDDQQDAEAARRAMLDLIDAGVRGVVGNMTSSMTIVCLPLANEHQVVMVSPTTSTNELTGIDDYFFRVYPASAETSHLLADWVIDNMHLRSAAVIYDLSNRVHTESAFQAFRETYQAHGGRVVFEYSYEPGISQPFIDLARQIINSRAECLYLLTNAMDAALICQQFRKLDHEIQFIASDWASTNEVITFGGDAVNGMFFMHSFDQVSDVPSYREFAGKYRDRFGAEANFAAAHGYDSANMLLYAMENQGEQDLQTVLKRIGSFRGVQSEIEMDSFGDAHRRHYPYEIRNNQFLPVAEDP